jgi:hypothetical protein
MSPVGRVLRARSTAHSLTQGPVRVCAPLLVGGFGVAAATRPARRRPAPRRLNRLVCATLPAAGATRQEAFQDASEASTGFPVASAAGVLVTSPRLTTARHPGGGGGGVCAPGPATPRHTGDLPAVRVASGARPATRSPPAGARRRCCATPVRWRGRPRRSSVPNDRRPAQAGPAGALYATI